ATRDRRRSARQCHSFQLGRLASRRRVATPAGYNWERRRQQRGRLGGKDGQGRCFEVQSREARFLSKARCRCLPGKRPGHWEYIRRPAPVQRKPQWPTCPAFPNPPHVRCECRARVMCNEDKLPSVRGTLPGCELRELRG